MLFFLIIATIGMLAFAVTILAFLEAKLTPRIGKSSANAALKMGGFIGALIATALGLWLQLPFGLSHIGLSGFAGEWIAIFLYLSIGMVCGGLVISRLVKPRPDHPPRSRN